MWTGIREVGYSSLIAAITGLLAAGFVRHQRRQYRRASTLTVSRLRTVHVLTVLIACGLAVIVAQVGSPAVLKTVFRECGLVENLTAGLFLAAFVLVALSATRPVALRQETNLVRDSKGPRQSQHRSGRVHGISFVGTNSTRLPLYLLALLGLAGFLDEISFGQRLFCVKMPVMSGVQIDAVHDLIEWAVQQIRVRQLQYHATAGFSAVGALLLLFLAAKPRAARFVTCVLSSPAAWYVGFAAVLLTMSTAIDVGTIVFGLGVYLEEALEMCAALSLLFATGCLLLLEDDTAMVTNDDPTLRRAA